MGDGGSAPEMKEFWDDFLGRVVLAMSSSSYNSCEKELFIHWFDMHSSQSSCLMMCAYGVYFIIPLCRSSL